MSRLLAGIAFLIPTFACAQTEMTLKVDASQAPMRIFHARLSMPVTPGPFTLEYAKWIPGEHMPTGPISNQFLLHLAQAKMIGQRGRNRRPCGARIDAKEIRPPSVDADLYFQDSCRWSFGRHGLQDVNTCSSVGVRTQRHALVGAATLLAGSGIPE